MAPDLCPVTGRKRCYPNPRTLAGGSRLQAVADHVPRRYMLVTCITGVQPGPRVGHVALAVAVITRFTSIPA
jgi:hypothetical protein